MTNTSDNTTLRMVALLSAVAILLFALSAVLFLTMRGTPLDDVLPWIVGWCGPTVPALLGYALLDKKLDAVHREVNGNTTDLLDRNASQSEIMKVQNQRIEELVTRLAIIEGRQQKI